MKEKKGHQYELTLEYVKNNKGEAVNEAPLEVKFLNHDNLFKIIEVLKEKDLFGGQEQTKEFAI